MALLDLSPNWWREWRYQMPKRHWRICCPEGMGDSSGIHSCARGFGGALAIWVSWMFSLPLRGILHPHPHCSVPRSCICRKLHLDPWGLSCSLTSRPAQPMGGTPEDQRVGGERGWGISLPSRSPLTSVAVAIFPYDYSSRCRFLP